MTENALILHRLDDMGNDIEEIKADVKVLREEGLPRRVGRLEKWKDSLSARAWVLITGMSVAVVAAWAGVLFGGGN